MFHVQIFMLYFLLFFSPLLAENPSTKNIAVHKVMQSRQVVVSQNHEQTQFAKDSLSHDRKSHIVALILHQKEKNEALESKLQIKNKATIFDVDALKSNIVYFMSKQKEVLKRFMISFCDKDDDMWVELEDVYFNGRYYRYQVLSQAARNGIQRNSCTLIPYDKNLHYLYFDDRKQFESALRAGASVDYIYQLAGLYPDGSPYSGDMVVSNSPKEKPSGRVPKLSSDGTPLAKGSQGGGSSGSSDGSTQDHQAKYQKNSQKSVSQPLNSQASLSNPGTLQNTDRQQAITENNIRNQDLNTCKNIERGFDPIIGALTLQDRVDVLNAHNELVKIYKFENSRKGKKLSPNNDYTPELVQQAQLIVKTGLNNPHWNSKKAIQQANKIVQVDVAAKAEALKKEQERKAAEKKAADEKKAFDDQQAKLHDIQNKQSNNQPVSEKPPVNDSSNSFTNNFLVEIVVASIKNPEQLFQQTEYKRKAKQEQMCIRREKDIEQKKIEQKWLCAAEEKRMQQKKAEKERINFVHQKYIQQKKDEIAFLDQQGYIYEPSEQDFIELVVHQLRLESARNSYSSMSSLSYDYLIGNKSVQLKKVITDSDIKVTYLQNKIAKDRYDWHVKALQEIAGTSKSGSTAVQQAKNSRLVDAHNIDDFASSKKLIKDSEHRYTMPSSVANAIRGKLIDRDNEYSGKVSADEIAIINFMLDAMGKANSSMTVEYAQAGLQACDDAQHAKSDQERAYHKEQAQLYYNKIKNGQANYSLANTATPVQASDLATMLQNYNSVLDQHNNTIASDSQKTHNTLVDRLEKRAEAIKQSQEQLRTNKLVRSDFKMSSQARGYLMANHLNYAAFDPSEGTNIQHCLTQENLDIIESAVQTAHRYEHQPETKKIVKQICNQAITAQQLNQRSQVQAAALLTDLNYINAYFTQIPEGQNIFLDLAIGTAQGHAQFLCKWAHFFKNLYQDPRHSVHEMGKDLRAIANALSGVASAVYDFTPLATNIDMAFDSFGFQPDKNKNADGTVKTYANQRSLKKMQTIEHLLSTSRSFVEYIQKSSLRKITTDTTEFADGMAVDGYLTHKAMTLVGSLAQQVGQNISLAGDSMYNLLPPELMDDVVTYATTCKGDILALTEKTAIDLGAAAVHQAAVNKALQAEKIAEKKKLINSTVNKITKTNQEQIANFTKSMESHFVYDKVINPERLKTINDVPQINLYRDFTNNFSPEGLAKLKPEEILHLNLCEWLEPRAKAINERIKKAGGIKFIDARGIEVFFDEFDLFHSLLGEVKPGSIRFHTKGGHILIPELQAALFDIGKFEAIGNGFFDMDIQYAGKGSMQYKSNTYFSAGTSIEQSVEIIEKAVENPKYIKLMNPQFPEKLSFHIENQLEQIFAINIDSNIARFHPLNPNSLRK